MPSLKHSAADWCFFKPHFQAADYYTRLKALGYSGIEMAAPERFATVKAAGLELVNISGPGMQQGLNRAENHAQLLPKIRELICVAHENQVRQVILFSGNRAGQPDSTGLKNCIAAIKDLASDAEKAKVTLLFEALNSRDHVDYQADHAAYAFDLARAVSSPAVRVLYDIYHLHRMGEELLDTILSNLQFIAHFHVAGSPKRDFPSEGQSIDYRTLVSRINAAGYRGYWGQEFLPAGDVFEELQRASTLMESYVLAPAH